jgi:hypothetical protein
MALPFSPLTAELLYAFMVKHLGGVMSIGLQSLYASYMTSSERPAIVSAESDPEKELDRIQMDRLLTWMGLVFEDTTPNTIDSKRVYQQELNNIYRTIYSDYQQYCRWKQINQNIWVFSSYRKWDTKALARKLLSDVQLFKEGLQLFCMMERRE